MNLVFRVFLMTLLNKINRNTASPTAPSVLTFRVMPHDLALRDHLPNFRYLSFFELGREDIMQKARLAETSSFTGRLLAAQDITYLREIKPFQKFESHTEIIGWDHKYCYYLHRIYCGGTLSTVALAKEAFVQKRKVISPNEIFSTESPALDAALAQWQTLQQTIRPLSEKENLKKVEAA